MGHQNAYASRKLNKAKRNYSMTKREALGMIFFPLEYHHYLLENPFIFYIDHQELKYLVKKKTHQGNVFQWLVLLQEFEFEVIV